LRNGKTLLATDLPDLNLLRLKVLIGEVLVQSGQFG
jgi:hypothetical protein